MTKEERAYNYASTCKATKLQVGEIAKHYNNGYEQAEKDTIERACEWLSRHYDLDLARFRKAMEDKK